MGCRRCYTLFTKSAIEEHTPIKPLEINSGYYFERSVMLIGIKILHKW